MTDIRPDNIILCGFMGTGKSTVGKSIADKLGWRFVDTDELIERRNGKAVKDIFAQEGEAAFRRMERELCTELVEWQETVVATGGGIVLNPLNRRDMQEAGLVVCLEAPAEEIVARLAGNTDRPLLAGDNPAARVDELLQQRANAYGMLPYHINTSGKRPEQIADEIIALRKETVEKTQPTWGDQFWARAAFLIPNSFPIDNPIFEHDIAQIKWLRGKRSPQRYGLTRLFAFYAFLLITILLLYPRNNNYSASSWLSILSLFIYLIPFTASVYGLYADGRYILRTVNTIGSQIIAGQWDLLRLTHLEMPDIIGAKHAAILISCWRIMTIDRALGTTSAVISLFAYRGILGYYGSVNYFGVEIASALLGFVVAFLIPYWRMRTMVAMGLAISARIQSTTYAILAGFGAIFAVRLVLWFISAIISFSMLSTTLVVRSSGLDGFALYTLFSALVSVVVSYLFYRVLEVLFLRSASRAAFQAN